MGATNAPDGQATSVDEVLGLYRSYANDRYDEDITQLSAWYSAIRIDAQAPQ